MNKLKLLGWMYSAVMLIILTTTTSTQGQSYTSRTSIKVGAYYFDGWYNKTPFVTPKLRDSFPDRKPVWGWITNTPSVMQAQINQAAAAKISFFCFDWYYPQDTLYKGALGAYLKAPNRNKLKFSVLVANHSGYLIGPKQWDKATDAWIKLFKNPAYFKVDAKPYLTFFSLPTLVQTFGSADAVHQAFDEFRKKAKQQGVSGVSIAVCVTPDAKSSELARECGFDVLTGYNYPGAGFRGNARTFPIDSLISGSYRIWDLAKKSPLPYIPSATVNWDPRPWATKDNWYNSSPRYTGFSGTSTYKMVQSLVKWINTNPDHTPASKVAILYAWNEYGEGGWLTPSPLLGNSLLNGVRKALSQK